MFKIKLCSFRKWKKFATNESCVIIANFNTRVKSLKNVSTRNFSIFVSSIWMTTSTSTKMSRCLREKFNSWAKSRSKIYIYLYFLFLFFNFFVLFFCNFTRNFLFNSFSNYLSLIRLSKIIIWSFFVFYVKFNSKYLF